MFARSVYRSLPARPARPSTARKLAAVLRPVPSLSTPVAARTLLSTIHRPCPQHRPPRTRRQRLADCRWLSTPPPAAPPPPAPPVRDPLHILFCGTDDFSCVSLQALHDEMASSPRSIASIQVLVRPAKRTGRGLKTVAESPVKRLAQQLGLTVHERDTFTGWAPPQPPAVNMVVAVSFGLFVPPRILRACAYGGLNVHPSLLPDLHGAAPIEHAILLGRETTGVTVQTLHETTWDGGRRLRAAPAALPSPDDIFRVDSQTTARALRERLAPVGARLLVEVIQQGLFLQQVQKQEQEKEQQPPKKGTPAPKLSKGDREIRFATAAQIERQARALGPVWTHVVGWKKGKPVAKRIIFEDVGLAACPVMDRGTATETDAVIFRQAGRDVVLPVFVDGADILLPVGRGAADGRTALRVRQVKIEGYQTSAAAQALGRYVKKTASDAISWDVVLGRA